MTEYTIKMIDAKKPVVKTVPSSDTYKMSGYAMSTVLKNAKNCAKNVGATQFSIMRKEKDKDALMGMWILDFSTGKWKMMFGMPKFLW